MITNFNSFIKEHIEFSFKNEYQKNRYQPILDQIMSANVGDILPNDIIYLYVEYLTDVTGKYDDAFVDGDLGDRLDKYSKYKLTKISISNLDLDEWNWEEEDVEDYQQLFLKTKEYPPIVVEKDLSIIDGTHRANALHNAGEEYILAFVGIK